MLTDRDTRTEYRRYPVSGVKKGRTRLAIFNEVILTKSNIIHTIIKFKTSIVEDIVEALIEELDRRVGNSDLEYEDAE